MSTKQKVAVIGAGLMGHGIALVFARYGYYVKVHDVSAAALAGLRDAVRTHLRDLDLDEAAAELITPCVELSAAVEGVDVVFEAGPENLEIKRNLFKAVEAFALPHALLASNTSVIPITQIMEGLEHRDRALGTHWWNPPYQVPLVEIIQTKHTSSSAVSAMRELLLAVGKTPVIVKKDVPGFIGNRLQHAMWREAISLVEHGVCDAETVDTVVKSSFGMRLAVLGPLENADLVGTDLTLAVHEHVLPDLDRTPGALPYLRNLVEQGRLGMKVGSGFRSWTEEQRAAVRTRLQQHLMLLTDTAADPGKK